MRRVARSLEVTGWLLLAAIVVTMFAPGCQGRECESIGFTDYGMAPGEGHLVDANTWESTPNNGTWLPFGPYQTWVFHPVGLEGRDLVYILPYVSADPDPNDPGKNFAPAAGNLAEIGAGSDSRAVFVSNSTCDPHYIRIVIVADPAQPNPFGADEGGIATGDAGDDSGSSVDLDAGDGGD
ncbi:MAG: hypothetical protein ACRELY_17460 [Polyangiaceae bacterium]